MHLTGIYEIRNLVNGKRYIGSAVDFGNRWRVHAQSLARGDHHSKPLQRAWNLYGACAFQFNKLLACSKGNLIIYEQACIDGYRPEYNVAPKAGSQLGFKHSQESREKMRASRLAYDFKPWLGKPRSEETKAKISANRRGKPAGEMTAERRAKISAAQKGRVITQEMRTKISAALTGTSTGRGKLTDDQVRAIRRLNEEGLRQSEIARRLDLAPKFIHTVVRGHGYTWVI